MIPKNNICRSDLRFNKILDLKVDKIWEYSSDLEYYLKDGCDPKWVNLIINELIDTLATIENGDYWKIKE